MLTNPRTNEDIDNMSDEDFMLFMENSTDSENFFNQENDNFVSEDNETVEVSEETKESNVNIDEVVHDKQVTEEAEDSNQEPEPVEEEDETDLKKDLEELRRYKEQISSKFEANGLELTGISDPDELIALQKDHVYKTEVAKQYDKARPVLDALKKNNLMEDKDKLALAIEASNGNIDAIKELMRKSNMDPIMMDMDDINKDSFNPSNVFQSEVETSFNDFLEKSNAMGVEDTLVNGVLEKWNNESVAKLIDEPGAKDTILSHMKSGAFDRVNAEVVEIERRDRSGKFTNQSDYDKYVIASNSLAKKLSPQAVEEEPNVSRTKVNVDTVIKPTKSEEVIVETTGVNQSEEKEDRLNNAIKASESSEVADKSTSNTGKVDLMQLNNDDFMKEMNNMMN